MDNDTVVALFFLVFVMAAYFLPTLIASMRGHHNTAAIFVLNAFLGWTFLGWVAALIWASTIVWKPVARKS